MLFFSLFLAGFTLGIFTALRIFAPQKEEETWDPQNLPMGEVRTNNSIAREERLQAGFSKNRLSLTP